MTKKLFITGCDSNTEWQLPWFVENFKKHNPNAELMIWDFGMNKSHFSEIRKSFRGQDQGWFCKPQAMLKSSRMADYVCWLDTDCHVLDNIEDIFNHVEDNKLAMVEDVPWSRRRGETWHNSGVVAFKGTPQILNDWVESSVFTKEPGDQEVLHSILRQGMKRMINITSLPRKYNVLRLDFLDGTVPKGARIHHWTGQKGNQIIKDIIDGKRT